MQSAPDTKKKTLQSAAAATGNGETLTVGDKKDGGYAYVCFQVTGTFTATVTFEGTVDGTNWVALEVASLGVSATVGSTATEAGIFRALVKGLYQVRARVSAYTNGSVTVLAQASA